MTAVLLIVRSHTRNNPTVHFRSSLSLMFESLYSYYYFSEYCRFPEFISHSNGIKVIQVSTRSLPALFLALKVDERRRGEGDGHVECRTMSLRFALFSWNNSSLLTADIIFRSLYFQHLVLQLRLPLSTK